MRNLDGWTDDGTDDGTDGWKGGPTPTNTAGQTDTTDIIMLEMGKAGLVVYDGFQLIKLSIKINLFLHKGRLNE
jgi:hypothetical protein